MPGPSTRPAGLHFGRAYAVFTAGALAVTEEAVITSSSPSGFAVVPSLFIKKLFVPGSYAHCSSPEEPGSASCVTTACVSVEIQLMNGGLSPG